MKMICNEKNIAKPIEKVIRVLVTSDCQIDKEEALKNQVSIKNCLKITMILSIVFSAIRYRKTVINLETISGRINFTSKNDFFYTY